MTLLVQDTTQGVDLGTYTNLASPSAVEASQCRNDTVKNRYRLQYAAKKLLPGERVSSCMSVPIITGGNVHILRDDETGHAHCHGDRDPYSKCS